MLISHRYKFIFIKTKKTAGTSLEIALSRYLGPDDVITHITPQDETLRQQRGGRGPQHFYLPLTRLRGADWRRWWQTRQRPYFYNHMPAHEISDYVSPKVWRDYYKFCFERNPWDKVISWYFWEHKAAPRPTLAEFLRAGRAQDLAAEGGSSLYTIDGQVVVDDIFRYEALEGALQTLTQRLGLPEVPQLPHAKGQFREDKRPYQQVYGEEERELVAAIFADEIARLGYRFD